MKTKELASLLGMSESSLRVGLQMGVFPFGTAFKQGDSTRFTYVIYDNKVKEYITGEGK